MYPHSSIEPKWQKYWAEHDTFECVNPELENSHKPKFYALDMFPYPSGAGLHVGHPKGYTATDIIARYKHAKGYHVLHPMGWDAFGLPAENYAIKTGTHPAVTTANNINRFREQLQRFGFSFDWNREVDTTNPEYYKWSQWIFLKLFEAGLAYESDKPINFCPSCKTGLANEEVVDGKCERCGTAVEKKPIRQWVLAITKYADRLLSDIDRLDWPEGIKEMQRNWIGRSEGCEFKMFKTPEKKQKVLVLHGFGGDSNENWFPWIATELAKYNTEVIVPSLVESSVPNLEKHMNQLAQYIDWVDEHTIIIGHSLGTVTALNFIARNNLKIKKFIAVGPVFETIDMNQLCSVSENITKVRNEFQSYLTSSQIDYQTVNKNIAEVVTYLSKTDPYIPLEGAQKEYQTHFPNGSFRVFEDKGHFNTKANILQFPEILDDILNTMSVYTTRIDTVYGMTYVVVAPDHPAVTQFITPEHEKECQKYIEKTKSESDQDRTNEKKEKTGVFTGSYVVNPYNGEKVPVWIADYVLGNYGTGAVMAVPAHDERDWDFAKKYGLEMRQSIAQNSRDGRSPLKEGLPIITRNSIEGILYNPRTDKFLCLEWNKAGWVTFITGGIEESEESYISAQREILEETGYKNLVHVGRVGPLNASEYYHPFKEVNRRGIFTSHLFILSDDERNVVQDEEHEKHQTVWLSLNEISKLGNIFSTDCLLLLIKLYQNKKDWGENTFHHILGDSATTNDGVLVYSDIYTGITSSEARIKLTEKAEKEGFGKKVTNYKLRDWIFSRQRYWGEPIPLIHISADDKNSLPTTHNDDCWIDGEVLKKGDVVLGKLYPGIDSWILPDYTLPLKLPEVEKYEPSGDGQSPLATIPDWVNVRLGNNLTGKRETNTMPQWAGSCWYYLRYMDPNNSEAIVDPAVVKYWGEADSYIGGAEHAVLHLLYARFWHKFLFDIGVVPSDEPFFKLRNVGLILGPDGEKMSKSKGNVINPDEVIDEYGADTLRMYEMSMADFSDVSPWNTKAIIGNYRLLEKIHRLFTTDETSDEFKTFLASDDMKAVKTMHKSIKKIGEDIENMKFNTAISMLNVIMNEGAPADVESRHEWKSALARLLHPFAPHMAEECWSLLGNEDSIYETEWPEYIEALTVDDEVMIAVQINGKLRGTYPFMRGVAVDEVRTTIESKPEITKWLEGATILKEIYIPNKILNIVIQS